MRRRALIQRPRKPRGIKKNGKRAQDLCPYCLGFNCDPGHFSIFSRKVSDRMRRKLCPSCGHKPCRCRTNVRNSLF